MNHDDTKSRLAGAVEAVRPEFGPALRGRTLAAMAEAPAPPRSRRRLVAALAFAAVALAALGFVPVPRSGGKGALTRAMAAMESAPGVFVRRGFRDPKSGRTGETREWLAAGGLLRREFYEKGELVSLDVFGKSSFVHYFPQEKRAEMGEFRHPAWATGSLLSHPEMGVSLSLDRASCSEVSAHLATNYGASVVEYRESSLWGGTRDVAERTSPGQGPERPAARTRYEFDPATGRLLSYSSCLRQGDSWLLYAWTEEVTWDVDVADDTWTFTPPAGTSVEVGPAWWSQHLGEPLAVGRTKDWEVTLYSMDRDSRCVYVAAGWRPLPGAKFGFNESYASATVTDSAGQRWTHYPRISWLGLGDNIVLLTLSPTDSQPKEAALPVSIELSIGRFIPAERGHGPEEPKEVETVTFSNVTPPPAREDVYHWGAHVRN